MIYYFPSSIDDQVDRASHKRPYEIQKFLLERDQGDIVISGPSKDRVTMLQEAYNSFEKGVQEIVYIESFNMPFYLNEIRNLSFSWIKELILLKKLKKKGAVLVLFYRDLYWRFPEFKKKNFSWKLKVFFYKIEWNLIKRNIDLLLLPTAEIAKYLPNNNLEILDFKPGIIENVSVVDSLDKSDNRHQIRLLYVGGVLPPFYKLFMAFELVNRVSNINLTICCREHEWEKVKHIYRGYDYSRVSIVHKSGGDLIPLYENHDVFIDLREPVNYYKYAFPYKYIESVSYNMPLVIIKGSSAEGFIVSNKFGWVCKDVEDAVRLFSKMNREEISAVKQEIQANKYKHTWKKRFEFLHEQITKRFN